MGTTTTWAQDRACTAPQCSTGTWVMDRTRLTTQHSQSHSHRGFNLAMTLLRFTCIYTNHPSSISSHFGAFSTKRGRTKITIPNITISSPINVKICRFKCFHTKKTGPTTPLWPACLTSWCQPNPSTQGIRWASKHNEPKTNVINRQTCIILWRSMPGWLRRSFCLQFTSVSLTKFNSGAWLAIFVPALHRPVPCRPPLPTCLPFTHCYGAPAQVGPMCFLFQRCLPQRSWGWWWFAFLQNVLPRPQNLPAQVWGDNNLD